MTSWGTFATAEPALASFVADRLRAAPAYLATLREGGTPRVHPVTPIIDADALYLFMEPTSPKGRDLRERRSYALHNGVADNAGTGGEAYLRGTGRPVEDAATRAAAVAAATYAPAERYVLFELLVDEVRCNGYGDVELPPTRRWVSPTADADPAAG